MNGSSEHAWRNRAACAGLADDLFFPVSSLREHAGEAIAVCAGCEVVPECLGYALSHGITDGIWGGSTGDERRKMPGFVRIPYGKLSRWEIPHGTDSGARWHWRQKEPLCDACAEAARGRKRVAELAASREAGREAAEVTA